MNAWLVLASVLICVVAPFIAALIIGCAVAFACADRNRWPGAWLWEFSTWVTR